MSIHSAARSAYAQAMTVKPPPEPPAEPSAVRGSQALSVRPTAPPEEGVWPDESKGLYAPGPALLPPAEPAVENVAPSPSRSTLPIDSPHREAASLVDETYGREISMLRQLASVARGIASGMPVSIESAADAYRVSGMATASTTGGGAAGQHVDWLG